MCFMLMEVFWLISVSSPNKYFFYPIGPARGGRIVFFIQTYFVWGVILKDSYLFLITCRILFHKLNMDWGNLM